MIAPRLREAELRVPIAPRFGAGRPGAIELSHTPRKRFRPPPAALAESHEFVSPSLGLCAFIYLLDAVARVKRKCYRRYALSPNLPRQRAASHCGVFRRR